MGNRPAEIVDVSEHGARARVTLIHRRHGAAHHELHGPRHVARKARERAGTRDVAFKEEEEHRADGVNVELRCVHVAHGLTRHGHAHHIRVAEIFGAVGGELLQRLERRHQADVHEVQVLAIDDEIVGLDVLMDHAGVVVLRDQLQQLMRPAEREALIFDVRRLFRIQLAHHVEHALGQRVATVVGHDVIEALLPELAVDNQAEAFRQLDGLRFAHHGFEARAIGEVEVFKHEEFFGLAARLAHNEDPCRRAAGGKLIDHMIVLAEIEWRVLDVGVLLDVMLVTRGKLVPATAHVPHNLAEAPGPRNLINGFAERRTCKLPVIGDVEPHGVDAVLGLLPSVRGLRLQNDRHDNAVAGRHQRHDRSAEKLTQRNDGEKEGNDAPDSAKRDADN